MVKKPLISQKYQKLCYISCKIKPYVRISVKKKSEFKKISTPSSWKSYTLILPTNELIQGPRLTNKIFLFGFDISKIKTEIVIIIKVMYIYNTDWTALLYIYIYTYTYIPVTNAIGRCFEIFLIKEFNNYGFIFRICKL